MKIVDASHLDHAISAAVLHHLIKRFADLDGFFVETIELPEDLGTVPCGLHGPTVGDEPIPEVECRRVVRGGRSVPSRICDRPPRQTRLLTVVAGPYDGDACVLYTAYGGPTAPREPWDPSLQKDPAALEASRAFWTVHALSA